MHLLAGVIMKGIGGFYYVKTEDALYECRARGIFRKDNFAPLPGDRVHISVNDEAGKTGNIDEILPRDSLLVRPAVANVNQLAAVLAAKSPAPDLLLLDKLLITAEAKGIKAILCINKIDLDPEEGYLSIVDAYSKAGYEIILLSSKTDTGFGQLRHSFEGRITVFAGQSGVGKSTILNRIMQAWVMQTGDISAKVERGRHTTRHAELVRLDAGGYVVDTPGFSSFELADIQFDEIERFYPEFAPHLGKCRFTHCSHISEPDCEVKKALEEGTVGKDRYERYIRFYTVLKENRTYKSK
jgi:ribosome biogenesis GTPase